MKAVLAIALVAVAVAAPYVIPLLGPAFAAGSLAAIAATAAVEVGVALLSSVLLAPHAPKGLVDASGLSRLYASMVTTEPRKIVFGYGPAAARVRYERT